MRSQRLAMFGVAIAGVSAAPPVAAAAPTINVPAGRLTQALTTLGRQAGIDILFSNAIVGDRATIGIRGKLDVGDALSRLLSGSGLTFHRTNDGAFVINRVTDAAILAPMATDATIPEILVVGRRAQNGDIRRTENDIQPYQVYTRRDVQRAHSDSVDDFARTRLSSNAQIGAPAQIAGTGETRSEINLRGLGPNQTLVLVDGRRLPNLPKVPFSFNQPDTSGIPIEMIDRIEVLSGTAGGVYGTGATSGAVNIVLRRDYNGIEVAATTGLTTRGDAFQYRLFGRIGFTPDHGRTEIMLAVSTMRNAVLHAGDRDYAIRARRLRYANDPAGYLAETPVGNGVNVYSTTPLTLDPEYGGTALGSTFTTLPLTSGLDLAQRNATLVANAGKTTLDLSTGIDGERASIAAVPSVRSIFVNARHDFGGGVEAFVDLLDSRNRGRLEGGGQMTSLNSLAPNHPNNPFRQVIRVAIPLGPFGFDGDVLNQTRRYTAGVIVPLPGAWRANAEYGGGRARSRTDLTNLVLGNGFFQAYSLGQPRAGLPQLDPLGDWARFQAALRAYAVSSGFLTDQSNKFRDVDLRLAGPLIELPGGAATLTLLAEERRETVRKSQIALTFDGSLTRSLQLPRVVQRVRSLYGETRLPVTGDRGLLSRLELQLAVRRDGTSITLPGAVTFSETDPPPFTKTRGTTLYTAGGRFSPLPRLMLRGSIATGALPPATGQIGSRQIIVLEATPDPKRGGRQIGAETTLTEISGGSPDLKPERARSLSIGLIVTPFGSDGPRLSLDFTRIDKREEIVTFRPTPPLG